MNKSELKELFGYAMGKPVPAEFANDNIDYKAALRDELNKMCRNYYDFQKNKLEVYELLAENAEEVLPAKVQQLVGAFAEVRQFGNNDRLQFVTTRGKLRGKSFVTRCTESGVYETFRLDRDYIELTPHAYGGAGRVDFERYLDGIDDIMDIYDIILEGLMDRIFEEIQGCLMASWNDAGRPSNNKVSVNGFDATKMAKLLQVVSAYGNPVIYCGPQFAATMANALQSGSTVKMSDEDIADFRNQGYIGKFAGAPVVVIPNSFVDDDNAKTIFDPRFAFIIPAGKEKLVRVALVGPTIIDDWKKTDRALEIQGYKKVAVGIVTRPNFWGMYYNSAIDAWGHGVIN